MKQSAHGAAIEIVRYREVALGKAIESSFSSEIAVYESRGAPLQLSARMVGLRRGEKGRPESALLPVGAELNDYLVLRKDFAFWPSGYSEGPHHAEVIGTIATLLQRARESDSIPMDQRLHSGSLQQVILDPENFARFDDGAIQAALLRAALPSELDYRGDANASEYMRDFLVRMARHLGEERSEAVLEFLTALRTGRLRIEDADFEIARREFLSAASGKRAIDGAVKFC